jgi:hypothetical protein
VRPHFSVFFFFFSHFFFAPVSSYHGGVVRFPSNVSGEWQTLVTPHQRILKRSTVFYIGKHMFHVAFPDANAAEDNVAVSTLAQSASLPPPSSASLPLAPSSVGSKAQFQPPHVQLVPVQHQQQQQQHQQQAPIVAQSAPRSVVSSHVPLARSSSHVAYGVQIFSRFLFCFVLTFFT